MANMVNQPEEVREVLAAVARKAAFRKGELKTSIAIDRARLAHELADMRSELSAARWREACRCAGALAFGLLAGAAFVWSWNLWR